MKNPNFQNSNGTVTFARTIDRPFDMLNSRNPLGKGYKKPLRLSTKETWEGVLKATANYLLTLKTDSDTQQLLATHRRKTFVIGFVATIKSTIEMATQMLSNSSDPFKYLLTYKFSQDHIELLFSCIRSKGGWNNPNSLQLKNALRQMLMRNAVTASKKANCLDFAGNNTIIPIFHARKHKSPLIETASDDKNSDRQQDKDVPSESAEIDLIMFEHLDQRSHSDFISNVLFYIGGFVVSKLVKKLTCRSCRDSLLADISPEKKSDHDYCGASRYSEVFSASAFTLFVNNGGLRIPSTSVFTTIEYCEHVFKAYVCKEDGKSITNNNKLKSKMILEVCHHFLIESTQPVFTDHEQGTNESVIEDDHQMKLIKCTADKYFTLRLFTFGKHYSESILQNGMPSDRHQLTQYLTCVNKKEHHLILFF